ncbi:MAG: hypothetical protein ACO3EE_04205 [Flavobacteriales bacterium]
MKRIASISFLLLMLIYSTHNFWLNLAFQFNQKEIASAHCENKAKPKMHCDGKCHLKKEIDKKNNQKSPLNNAKEKFEILFFSDYKSITNLDFTTQKENAFAYVLVQYNEPYFSIVHPPA